MRSSSSGAGTLLLAALIATVVLLLAAAMVYARREAGRLRIQRFSLDLANPPCGGPTAFDGYRIVFASDFHVLRVGPFERKVLDSLAALRGDLLILGGDYQDHRKKPVDGAIAFVDKLAELAGNFADGIVAVRGNHDSRTMREYLRHHRAIRYLGRTAFVIERGNDKIAIAGVRRSPRKSRKRMERRAHRIAASMPDNACLRVLVSHWPDYFPAARREKFDLVLAGDTHGGQVRLPLVGAVVRKTRLAQRYAFGLVREEGSTLYTTSGIGTRSFPLRLFCPPEIVVFELRAAESARKI